MIKDVNSKVINILWTGGWDSTFRIISLILLNNNKIIQPYYIIDSQRVSAFKEIETMDMIRLVLYERYPWSRNILKPVNFVRIEDVKPNLSISRHYQNLLRRSFLGSQYDWLSRFAEQMGIFDLELSIHKDDRASKFLAGFVERINIDNEYFFKLKPAFLENDEDLAIFQYFKFPVFDLSKLDMDNTAKKSGFSEILELTWFCFNPLADGSPCGKCNSCIYAVQEGLGRRIGLNGKICYFLVKGKKFLKGLLCFSREK